MKRAEAAERAREIYEHLMSLPRGEMSQYEWTKRAGVNTSFFTGLRNGSEPSIGSLRSVLKVVGVTLPEFFVDEAAGRLIVPPTRQALETALQSALSEAPKRLDKRVEYVAEVVIGLLGLQRFHQLVAEDLDTSDSPAPAAAQPAGLAKR